MRRRRQHGLGEDALDRCVRALAGRTAGAVGHRDEVRLERREPADRLPQRLLHFRGLRRKELERDADAARRIASGETAGAGSVHQATSRVVAGVGERDARIAREPERDRDLALAVRAAASAARTMSRPGGFEPLRHRFGGKAEPAMGVLVAQEFEIVRREIDDQQPPAGPQHARRLADGAGAVVEEVQHLMDDDDVEGIARQGEIVDVAMAHAAMLEARRDRGGRARAPACRARDRGRGRARYRRRKVRACARCRCRDRAASGSACRRAPRGSPLRPRHRRRAACGCGPTRRHAAGNNSARRRRARRVPRPAARGRGRWPDRSASSRAISARAMSAALPRSPRRKNAHDPSRKRSTSPASAKSRRWRERRGCDWRRIAVRSETVSSASAISISRRRRVASPAALSVAVRAGKLNWAESITVAVPYSKRHKDIFMRLNWQGQVGDSP